MVVFILGVVEGETVSQLLFYDGLSGRQGSRFPRASVSAVAASCLSADSSC